ncbi:unnamed protein product [Onchocerca flexuosa]|uniref:Uncharacterized protein n=1 Tax=Onchocerca flexuosa TaxID=387005 RepID=A0A183HJ07_9BILA|nr:unnamed protein product [Onchocerca flexuosa]
MDGWKIETSSLRTYFFLIQPVSSGIEIIKNGKRNGAEERGRRIRTIRHFPEEAAAPVQHNNTYMNQQQPSVIYSRCCSY